MMFILSLTTFNNTIIVVGPSAPPTPQTVLDVIKYGKVNSALLTPALIEEICLSETGLDTLRGLTYVQYAGAPLAAKAGNLLVSHTNVVPTIGSTEAGGYITKRHDKKDAWDYISFHENAGAVFEPRFDDLHELVFVRQPDDRMQSIFKLYTDRDRYETNDLWAEHPVYKGLWKIIGRADDHVSFSHGEGLHASRLEPDIEAHPAVKSALIGGHGYSGPVLLLELYGGTLDENDRDSLFDSLQSNIDKVNAQVHECVALSADRIIIATEDKPFVRTVKGSVGRVQTLASYKDEIAALFA
jgi:acyl-coenzyme A synthetase/AMP-(fatty) acid ligase